MTDWSGLTAPSGAVALITARCARCFRVAAKYWEHNDDGTWIAPTRNATLTTRQMLDDSVRVRNMVAARVCHCTPPPILPTGEELAAHVARAHRELPSNWAPAPSPFRLSRITPLTIRV